MTSSTADSPIPVVVLGATSDLGKSLTSMMAQRRRGARILAVSRKPQTTVPVPSLNDGLDRLEGVELTAHKDLRRLSREVGHWAKGAPFAIVHCVGDFWYHRPLTETPLEEAQRMIVSHLVTLVSVAHALTPIMRDNGGGRLVAFSCNSVAYSYPDMSPFTAAKAGVESFIRCYANENAGHNIVATAVALPTVATEKVLRSKPIVDPKLYLAPDEVAVFLLDDVLTLPLIANGNVVKVFRHNREFYEKSYYDRNPVGHRPSKPTAT